MAASASSAEPGARTSSASIAKAAGLDSDAITLTRFILTEQRKHPAASGDFSLLMSSISLACKATAVAVKKAGIAGLYGIEGVMNVQGEKQKKLDVIANDNFVNALTVRLTFVFEHVLHSARAREPSGAEEDLSGFL